MPITNVSSTSTASQLSSVQRSNDSDSGHKIADAIVNVCQSSEQRPMTYSGQKTFDGLMIAAAGVGVSAVGTMMDSKALTIAGNLVSIMGLSTAAYGVKEQDQTTLAMQQQTQLQMESKK
ncbi:hypothetical protein G7083_07145 [Vibrio sp. HDW18]|uniref:hypothetical protein n=1 Tax=Vibrio sp. HDW18 TaxID=2714948 RepID=UPI00140A6058|nr:hypothetical protein [Vibrio sp. HDW18]QIL85646.1 hypothetical protein G7083_07145 [Vibrio sp. HDW18]